jgi:HlyD family secretion protein
VEAVQVRVSTQISGTVRELLAEEGDRVQKGTPLAVLEREDLDAQLAAAESAALSARARLADLEAGSRVQEIRQAQAALEQALAQYEKARLDSGRYRKLLAEDAAAESMVEDVSTRFEVSRAQVRQAQERIALLKAGARPNQILAAKAEAGRAEKALDALRVTWSHTRIESPVDGVVQVKNAEPGEVVPPNFPVYTVLNPLDVWVRVYIPESQIPNIRTGAQADVVLDAFPDSRISGTVTYISPEAEFTPRNVQTKEERVNLVFEVKVTIDNPGEGIRPGLPADVFIKTAGDKVQ